MFQNDAGIFILKNGTISASTRVLSNMQRASATIFYDRFITSRNSRDYNSHVRTEFTTNIRKIDYKCMIYLGINRRCKRLTVASSLQARTSGVAMASAIICFAGDKKGSETIKPPEHLSLSEFLPIWFSSQEKIKYDRNLVKVKQDDTFCYYSLSWLPERPAYKVRTSDLSKIDIDHIDVFAIHAQFQEQVVPVEDRRRFECQGYTAGIESGGYKYRYIEDKNAMEINCILKANCDFIVRAINKSYTAEYYFDTGEFIKTDEHEIRKKK